MTAVSTFRKELEDAILERHCAHHPMTQNWARGELSRNALMGWGVEHYHWISSMGGSAFYRMAQAPADAREMTLRTWLEERDPQNPHLPIVLRFAVANGADPETVRQGRGLPTTEAWAGFLRDTSRNQSWIASMAAILGTESQSPLLYSTVLPALREIYQFDEHSIEHFWLHSEADVEHGNRWFDLLERHCTTEALRQEAIHWARESARFRWLYFDGIYLYFEQGYPLR
jgi:pyrroloquinoline-quinone synthase